MEIFCVLAVTPPTSVDMISPLNLLGSSLTLTCSVGAAAMLDPGVQIQVQWTDSSGGAVAGGTPAMGSGRPTQRNLMLGSTTLV